MTSVAYEFISNEQIEAFSARDTMMEVTGYVDSIDGIRAVQTFQKWIYKCVLKNDAGTRLRVVFWGNDALKYSEELRLNEILEITGGTIGTANRRFSNPNEKICLNEFHVQSYSTLRFHGPYRDVTIEEEDMFTETTIADVLSVDEPVCMDVYIKTEFTMVKRGNNGSFSSGVVADEVYRLCVQIVSFILNEKLQKGLHVQLKGYMEKNLPGSYFLKVADMRHIKLIEVSAKLPLRQLKIAILGPNPKIEDVAVCTKRLPDNENEVIGEEKEVQDKKIIKINY